MSGLFSHLGSLLNNANLRVMFSGFVANLFFIATGCAASYPSPAVPNINQNRNPFRVSDDQQSWIGSLNMLGYAVGAVVCGTVSDAIGRKLTMLFSPAFCVVGFTLVSAATHVQMIYVGVIITGIFNAITNTSVLLYSSEIASQENRGILVSMSGTFGNAGMVVVLVAGSYLPWNWLAIFTAALYSLPPLVLVFLPESPRWFLLKGNREAAAHGLRWFRGKDADIDAEMAIIGGSLVDVPTVLSSLKDLFQWKHAKPLLICCILFLLQGFSGFSIATIFTVTIFEYANVAINPNLQSVITGLFALLGGVLSLFAIERCGRRSLLLFSTINTAIGMGMLAVFFQVQDLNPDYTTHHLFWIPMLGLSLATFMFSLGLSVVPWVLACELFSTNVRGTVITISNVFYTLATFAATKTFSNIATAIGTSGAFWFYAACDVAGTAFVLLVVREPKQEMLN